MESKNQEKKLEQLEVIKPIGSGGYSIVYLVHDKDEKLYAAKVFKEKYFNFGKFEKEANIQKQLVHKNICKYIEHGQYPLVENKNQHSIIMEYANQRSFLDYGLKQEEGIDENIAKAMFKQLIDGLSYLHEQGFSHRDLKPDNILLDKGYVLKITDFGFTSETQGNDKSGLMKTDLGTERYKAPEFYKMDNNFNLIPYKGNAVDIFASGIALLAVLVKKFPFKNTFNDLVYKLIENQQYDEFWSNPIYSKLSKDVKDLIQKMIEPDPEKRITIEEIQLHVWLQGPFIDLEELFQKDQEKKFENFIKKKEEQKKDKKSGQNVKQINTRSRSFEEEYQINASFLSTKFDFTKERKLKQNNYESNNQFLILIENEQNLLKLILQTLSHHDNLAKNIELDNNEYKIICTIQFNNEEEDEKIDDDEKQTQENIQSNDLIYEIEIEKNKDNFLAINLQKIQGDQYDWFQIKKQLYQTFLEDKIFID